jgi:hypothetical protein
MAMKSQWFYIAWTLQEIAMAKKAVVICGQRQMPWVCFHGWRRSTIGPNYSAAWLNELNQRIAIRRRLLADTSDTTNRRSSVESVTSDGSSAESDMTIAMKLLFLTHLEATDPRDQIYGLLAVYRKLGLNLLSPDYAESVSQVFKAATLTTI